MVGPKQKKEAVKHVLAQGSCSLRRACQYFGLHRSTYLYEPKKATEYRHKLVARIIAFSKKHPRFVGPRRLARESQIRPKSASFRRTGCAPVWQAPSPVGPIHGYPDPSSAAQPCVELGLRGGSHRPGRSAQALDTDR